MATRDWSQVMRGIARLLRAYSDDNAIEMVRGAATAFGLKGAGSLASVGFNVALARFLGPAEAGLYFIALTVVNVAGTVGKMGLDNALLRFGAGAFAVRDWARLKGVYAVARSVALIGALTTAVTLILLAPWLANSVFHKSALKVPLYCMAFAVPPVVLFNLEGEALKSLRRIFDSQLVQGVVVPLAALPLLVGLRHLGALGACISYVSGACVAMLVGMFLWKKATPELAKVRSHLEVHLMFSSSMPAFGVALMNLILSWSASIMMGMWRPSSEVALFSVAARVAALIGLFLLAVNSIAAPQFAALFRQGRLDELGILVRKTTLFLSVLASPVILVFILRAQWVMSLFGPAFVKAAPMLVILTLGQFANVVTGPVGYLLMMTGKEHLMQRNYLVTSALTLLANWLLIPRLGGIGAAIGSAFGLTLLNVISAIIAYRVMHIRIVGFPTVVRGIENSGESNGGDSRELKE